MHTNAKSDYTVARRTFSRSGSYSHPKRCWGCGTWARGEEYDYTSERGYACEKCFFKQHPEWAWKALNGF